MTFGECHLMTWIDLCWLSSQRAKRFKNGCEIGGNHFRVIKKGVNEEDEEAKEKKNTKITVKITVIYHSSRR